MTTDYPQQRGLSSIFDDSNADWSRKYEKVIRIDDEHGNEEVFVVNSFRLELLMMGRDAQRP